MPFAKVNDTVWVNTSSEPHKLNDLYPVPLMVIRSDKDYFYTTTTELPDTVFTHDLISGQVINKRITLFNRTYLTEQAARAERDDTLLRNSLLDDLEDVLEDLPTPTLQQIKQLIDQSKTK